MEVEIQKEQYYLEEYHQMPEKKIRIKLMLKMVNIVPHMNIIQYLKLNLRKTYSLTMLNCIQYFTKVLQILPMLFSKLYNQQNQNRKLLNYPSILHYYMNRKQL